MDLPYQPDLASKLKLCVYMRSVFTWLSPTYATFCLPAIIDSLQ